MMSKSRLIGLFTIVLSILLISGCSSRSPSCPNSCDDGNHCTNDFCSSETSFSCAHELMTPCSGNGVCERGEFGERGASDCPNCDDNNSCTSDSFSYETQQCTHTPIDCNDNNDCTKDTCLQESGCFHETVSNCLGNGICEEGEYGTSECPYCDDNEKCTKDSLNYTLKTCVYTQLPSCCGKNGCVLNVSKSIDNYISVAVEKIFVVSDEHEDYFIRTDVIVENTGDEKITFSPYSAVIIGKSSNQFDRSYFYDKDQFEYGEIYPGVIRKGRIFFKVYPNPELDVKTLIIPTGLTSYYRQSRNIGHGQSLYYNDDYVFAYDISNLTLVK